MKAMSIFKLVIHVPELLKIFFNSPDSIFRYPLIPYSLVWILMISVCCARWVDHISGRSIDSASRGRKRNGMDQVLGQCTAKVLLLQRDHERDQVRNCVNTLRVSVVVFNVDSSTLLTNTNERTLYVCHICSAGKFHQTLTKTFLWEIWRSRYVSKSWSRFNHGYVVGVFESQNVKFRGIKYSDQNLFHVLQ